MAYSINTALQIKFVFSELFHVYNWIFVITFVSTFGARGGGVYWRREE